MKLFSVQDTKAQAFMNPAAYRTSAEAIRSFQGSCQDPQTSFAKFPSDFILFEIAEWDELTGTLTPHEKPRSLATASEFASKS